MRDSRATHGKWLQIVVIILSQALSDLSFGVIAPFFPVACLDRGIQHGTVGAIFMTQQVVALLFTPLAPWLCRRLGNRVVILCTTSNRDYAISSNALFTANARVAVRQGGNGAANTCF